eukprot:360762-Chlamydomonas_euryale.AAC.10
MDSSVTVYEGSALLCSALLMGVVKRPTMQCDPLAASHLDAYKDIRSSSGAPPAPALARWALGVGGKGAFAIPRVVAHHARDNAVPRPLPLPSLVSPGI